MIENAITYVKQIFADDCSGHDYYHIMRVYRLAIQIAEQENADMVIVQLTSCYGGVPCRIFSRMGRRKVICWK